MTAPGLKYAETIIGGSTWGLNTLPSTKSLEAFGVILDTIGPGAARLTDLFNAITGGAEDDLEEQIDGAILGMAVEALTTKIADPKTTATIKLLLTGLRKDGAAQPINFDHEFSGNFGALPELIAFAIGHNYKSFLESGLFAELSERVRKKFGRASNHGSNGE